MSDLAAAEPTLAGQLQANGHVAGTTDNLDLTADLTGGIAGRGMSSGTLTSRIEVHGLPNNAERAHHRAGLAAGCAARPCGRAAAAD